MRRAPLLTAAVLAALSLFASTAAAADAPPGHSYADTSKVPIDPRTGEALAAPVRTPPENEPRPEDVADCTNAPPDPANPALGRVHNRFLWCRKTYAYFGTQLLGEARIHYTAIAYGRDDGQRSVRIFFRADRLEKIGKEPPGDIAMFQIGIGCQDRYEPRQCVVAGPGPIRQSLFFWRDDHSWYHWDVRSEDPGSEFNVFRHQWRFEQKATEPDRSYPDVNGVWHNIRCDSEGYFRMGGDRPKACVFTDVIPHLIYRTSDDRIWQIARHVRDAQDRPGETYPVEGGKVIPGKYLSGAGLHRIPSGSPEFNENRKQAEDACHSRGRYVDTGMTQPPGEGQHCDEYPFASTEEGAAQLYNDFSVRAVSGSHNCSAGALLGWYYVRDRILYGSYDEFFVEILDGPPGGGDLDDPPPDAPPGGGEEPACGVIPPNPSPTPVPGGQLRISDVAVTEGDSGSQDATVTVSVNRPTGEAIAVNFATADGTATAPEDYQARSGRITFGPDERSKRITVPVNGDTTPEPDEAFFVRLSSASGGTIDDDEARVIIRTDPEPALSINDVRIEEEDADVTFTASLTEANNTPVSMDFATANVTATAGADYDARSGRLDIPVGATSGTIAVHTREDFDDEIDEETFKLALSNVANVFVTDGEGVATIRDDDRNGLFMCRAAAARLGSTELGVANPPFHPCRDDNPAGGQLDIGLGGIGVSLRTVASTDQTPDDLKGTKPAVGDKAVAHAEAKEITIRAGINLVRLEAFVSDASAECASPPDAPRLASGSRITNLTVGGLAIPVGSDPVRIPLVLATLKLNETARDRSGVTQRALVLDQLLGPDLVLGEARAGWRGTSVHPDGHPCVV